MQEIKYIHNIKRVITFGVFDMFHYGHLRLFKNIKRLCGDSCHLIVATQDSDFILKYKPTARIIYNTNERVEMLKELKVIDSVVIYTDIDKSIKEFDFDIWAKGPDQIHEGFQRAIKWCYKTSHEIIEIPRTEGISSSFLKSIADNT
jgi:cytidyltransferase-like protein